ncbi:hypothetical protein ACMFMG_008088 [Clarireedia jacksonii]
MVPTAGRPGQPPNGELGDYQKEGATNVHSDAKSTSHSEAGSVVVHSPDVIEILETPSRVRTFDQLGQSDEEVAIISKEEFSVATEQQARSFKRAKTVHGTTPYVALQNYEISKLPPVDDSDVPRRLEDLDAPDYVSVPFEGMPATPSFHHPTSPLENNRDAKTSPQTPPPNPYYSSGAELSPPTPGDMLAFNAYISKLRVRRANKVKLKGKAITDGSALTEVDYLSPLTQKTVMGQWNSEKVRTDKAHTLESATATRAEDAYESDPTSEYHSSYGSAFSAKTTTQMQRAASLVESSSPLWVTPQASRFTSLENASRSASNKAHTPPTATSTNGRSTSLFSSRNGDEIITSTENVDASCLSTSDTSTITKFLLNDVSRQERSVNPSPSIPSLSIQTSALPGSDLSDPPGRAGSDPFEEASVQVDVAQSHSLIRVQGPVIRMGGQVDNQTPPPMNSLYIGVNRAKKAGKIDEKDPYYKLVVMLFDGVPREVYEGLKDQKILRTSLSDVARWTRPRDDNIHICAIARDPSGAELIQVVAEIEILLITMWAAVESMAVLLYADLNDGFTIGMLQEYTRHWQTEVYRTYELLIPHLTTIARWKESYFAVSNIKKRSVRRSQTNPYGRLFEKTTVTGHLAYGSAAYLRKFGCAISSANCAYNVACIRGQRRTSFVGQHRSELGKEYDICLRGLRNFNQFIMRRDWDVREVVKIIATPPTFHQRDATPGTPSCVNSIVVETSALQENHVSKTNKIADNNSIDNVIAEGNRAASHTPEKDESQVQGYLMQPARQKVFATSPSPDPQANVKSQDEVSRSITVNEMEYEANEVGHKVADECLSTAGTPQRLGSAEAEKAAFKVDISR